MSRSLYTQADLIITCLIILKYNPHGNLIENITDKKNENPSLVMSLVTLI